MSALESSIESLTAEHAALSQKLEQIDQQYRVDRPLIVNQIGHLARALSALTGKPVAGAKGAVGRKPMSEAGKAAIRAGLEKARAAKLSNAEPQGPVPATAAASSSKPNATIAPAMQPVPVNASDPASSAKKPVTNNKGAERGN